MESGVQPAVICTCGLWPEQTEQDFNHLIDMSTNDHSSFGAGLFPVHWFLDSAMCSLRICRVPGGDMFWSLPWRILENRSQRDRNHRASDNRPPWNKGLPNASSSEEGDTNVISKLAGG